MRTSHNLQRFQAVAFVLLAMVASVGCKAKAPPMMTTPALYSSTTADIDRATLDSRQNTTVEVFYATDRVYDPTLSPDPYPAERQDYLRLGVAKVRLGSEEMTWEDLSEASTSMERKPGDVLMYLGTVEDFGPLVDTLTPFDPEFHTPEVFEPARRYAELINERLAETDYKDVNIYVAPFKVHFDVGCFTAAEFYHYLGRHGVFVNYSWPTATGVFDYFSATENAYLTIRNLRIFLEYLARETDAEHINLITYSAGARVLSGALHALALKYSHYDEDQLRDDLRIGQVVFTGPDIDREAFNSHFADGAAHLADGMTIYTTKKDKALGMSQWIYGWQRLGTIDVEDMTPEGIEFLSNTTRFALVRVTNAEEAMKANAHGYFRASPWVSSDVLLTLAFHLPPDERCLYRDEGDPVWRFPEDYRERVAELVTKFQRENALPPE